MSKNQVFLRGEYMNAPAKSAPPSGFSFVEFLMILSAVAILLSSVDSWLSNYDTRSKVSEALSVAETAKIDIVITCAADPALAELSEEFIGHDFPHSHYVKSVTVGGTCKAPIITLVTDNTGLNINPTLHIAGTIKDDIVTWSCRSTGLDMDKPQRCRDS